MPGPAGSVINELARLSGARVGSAIPLFLDRFRLELRHFMEVGLVLEPTTLSLITLGCGSSFGNAVGSLLRDLGLASAPEEVIEDLQANFDAWMLVRVSSDPEDRPEVDLYFRRPRKLDAVIGWLANHDVNVAEQRALMDLARLADTDHIGIFGASFRKGEPVLYKAYVQVRPRRASSLVDQLEMLFEHFRIPGQGWRSVIGGLDRLGARGEADAYVSLLLGDGDAFDSLKLDLFHVDLEAFTNLATSSGLVSEDTPSPHVVGETLSLSFAEHCGFRFDDHGASRLTVYLSTPMAQEDS